MSWLLSPVGAIASINNVDDIVITAAAKGDMLVFNGTNWIDVTVGADGTVLVADVAEVSGVRWAGPRTATTTQLADVTDAINTVSEKVAGFMVFNTTTGLPVWAVGAADASVWNDATGATAHTPV